MLAWFAFALFKKLMTAVDSLEGLGSQVTDLDLNLAELAPDRFTPAVLLERDDLALAVDLQRADRATRKALRRDSLIARGKLFQRTPYTQRTKPHA